MPPEDCIRLDSVPSHPSTSKWAYAPSFPIQLLTCDSKTLRTELRDRRGVLKTWSDPLDALKWMEDDIRSIDRRNDDDASSDFRWIGYLSYDLGRLFERLPSKAADDLDLPLFAFTFHDPWSVDFPAYPPGTYAPFWPLHRKPKPTSTFTREQYLKAVSTALDYISAGDIFQLNLSQRFTVPCHAEAATIYDRLRSRYPAPYGAFLDHGHYAILSNSPELFLRVEPPTPAGHRRVITRPIKGTRPRADGMEAELRDSIKDQAELNMIVDLERNDLGRVCQTGSVKVTQPRTIEAHPTVYHGVATVEGLLRPDVDLVSLLRATFPGGSITGAPKIRAMEIIDELEPTRRGPYCGAIGYLAADGTIEFNVAIRTMILKDGLVHIPVGGGIVADSTPESEYEETLVKARAMFDAAGAKVPNS